MSHQDANAINSNLSSVERSNWKNGSGTNSLVEIPSPACAEMVFIAHRYFHKNHGPPRITKIHANQGKLFVHHPHVCKFVSSKRIELIGLILKNRRSSLKWAQVEVISSIRVGATVFQSWCFFLGKKELTPHFVDLYLFNGLSQWLQLELILKNRHSSLKWA